MTERFRGIRGWKRRIAGLRREQGAVIVIVMMFCMIFLVLGLALYWLSASQIRGTETERKDVKAFNVAEAGVDAGMLALKLDWPWTSADHVIVDDALLKTALQAGNSSLWDPTRSSPSEFLQVSCYDNSAEGVTVTEPPGSALRVGYDVNADGMMFVEASSNVDDDRHRILLLAERQKWDLNFPVGTALFSSSVDSNGQGFDIVIEDGGPPVYYDVHDTMGKGINEGDGIDPLPSSTAFDTIITHALLHALEGLAIQKGTYFTDDDAAETFLNSSQAAGSVVYIKTTTLDLDIDIESGAVIGTVAQPVVVVIDTPDGSTNDWNLKGGADFVGILVVLGDSLLTGTSSTHGAIFCEGELENRGNGADPELCYNYSVIKSINRQYVLSVNIVPNTWEEYTVPAGTATTVAGP